MKGPSWSLDRPAYSRALAYNAWVCMGRFWMEYAPLPHVPIYRVLFESLQDPLGRRCRFNTQPRAEYEGASNGGSGPRSTRAAR